MYNLNNEFCKSTERELNGGLNLQIKNKIHFINAVRKSSGPHPHHDVTVA